MFELYHILHTRTRLIIPPPSTRSTAPVIIMAPGSLRCEMPNPSPMGTGGVRVQGMSGASASRTTCGRSTCFPPTATRCATSSLPCQMRANDLFVGSRYAAPWLACCRSTRGNVHRAAPPFLWRPFFTTGVKGRCRRYTPCYTVSRCCPHTSGAVLLCCCRSLLQSKKTAVI